MIVYHYSNKALLWKNYRQYLCSGPLNTSRINTYIETVNKGVRWTSVHQVGLAIINLLKVSILARFLAEETFGLYAVTLMVLGFTLIFSDLGISTSLFHKQEIDQKEYSSLYWINIIFNVILYFVLLMIIPLVVLYYEEPRLSPVISLIGINLIFNSLGKHHLVYAQKKFYFKQLAIIDLVVNLISLVLCLVLAIRGFEIYALVYSSLFTSLFLAICYFFLMQKEYPLSFTISISSVRKFLVIGLFQSGSQILAYIAKEVDTLIIGRFLGMDVLGIYTIIKQFTLRIYGIFNSMVSKIAIPTFSSFNDREDLLKMRFINLIKKLSLVNAFIYSNLAVLSFEVLYILFGESFSAYSFELRLFCLYYFTMSIINFCSILIIAKGKTKNGFYWTIFNLIASPGLVILFASYYGLTGVLYGYLAFSLVGTIVYYRFILKNVQSNINANEFFNSFMPNLFMGLSIFALGILGSALLNIDNLLMGLAYKLTILLVINGIILYFFKKQEILDTLKVLGFRKNVIPNI